MAKNHSEPDYTYCLRDFDNSLEIWKDIKDWENWYQVSSWGRVKSLFRTLYYPRLGKNTQRNIPEIIMTPRSNPYGYFHAGLCREKKVYNYLVHRLVLEAFVCLRPEGLEACHNDGSRTNNRVENLRWDTHAGNMQDRKRHGTCTMSIKNGEEHPCTKMTVGKVIEIRKLYASGEYYQRELGNMFEIDQATISDIVNRNTWKQVE